MLDRSLLWPLMCALPERQRAVIVLRYYEDLSEAQIADVLGCAPGTVKSQASAAIGGAPTRHRRDGYRRGGGGVMNLGEQLRAALNQEADMQPTPPDIDGLITGGRDRRRRRNMLWAGGAALAVVLVGGGAYAVTQREPATRQLTDK